MTETKGKSYPYPIWVAAALERPGTKIWLRPKVSRTAAPVDIKKFGKKVRISPVNVGLLKEVNEDRKKVTVTFGQDFETGPMDIVLRVSELDAVDRRPEDDEVPY